MDSRRDAAASFPGSPGRQRTAQGGAEGLPWWRRATVPFHAVVASLVVGAMVLLAAVLALQVSRSARQAIVEASDENAQRIATIINERVRRIVDPADASLRLLAFDPVASATTLPQRLQRLPLLAGLLSQNPLLASVFVGYRDGQFLLVRPLRDPQVRQRLGAPPSAAFLVQSRAREGARGLVGRWTFYGADLRLLHTGLRPEYQFDPRTRPWYQEGREGQSLTAPYVFFTTQEVGVTLSQPSADGLAVLGLDVALSTLGREAGGLRLTPRSEIAVVDGDGHVLAYPEMQQLVQQDGDQVRLRSLAGFGVDSLRQVGRMVLRQGESRKFMSGGEEWLGLAQPLDALRGRELRILMAIPTSELLAGANATLREQLWLSVALILLLLPLGWWAGERLGRSLNGLALQARSLARFDFRRPERPLSPLREVRALGQVMDDMSDTIREFLDLSHHISAESRLDLMLSSVLHQLVRATHCMSGAVYLVQDQRDGLRRAALHCEDEEDQGHYPEFLGMAHFTNHAVPREDDDLGGDAEEGGVPQRPLRVQLRTREGQPLGLLSLRYAAVPGADLRSDDAHFRSFVEKLSGTLSVAIETRNLIEGQRKLFDAVIRLLADAIDAKSPYTGGHCERVPQLAEMLMQRLCDTQEAPFAAVSMTEAERYEFRLGAWLHDCGKVTSPEHVIDKATKLETLYNRIHEVRMRFEVLWRDAEIDYWRACMMGSDFAQQHTLLRQRRQQLEADFAFVAACNIGGEAMADADVERLAAIGQQTWLRHFDNRLGLSRAEIERLGGQPPGPLPEQELLLADRPDHIVPWGARRPPVEEGNPANRWGFRMRLPAYQAHLGELYNLSVRRGTLTAEDRFKINDHIVQTIIMLRGLPFPASLARVPDIAGTHHEKLDGTGYPRGLDASQLTLADRVMALADIFEALTAADRPYKPPKTLSESLGIMAGMVRDRHLDEAVFRFFLASGVWREYAERFLTPQQRDEVDLAVIGRMLAPAVRVVGDSA